MPEIFPGLAGIPGCTETFRSRWPLVPQEFIALTEMVPFFPVIPVVTTILFDPSPEIIIQPAGTDQS